MSKVDEVFLVAVFRRYSADNPPKKLDTPEQLAENLKDALCSEYQPGLDFDVKVLGARNKISEQVDDQSQTPWFAPAGMKRGVISNARVVKLDEVSDKFNSDALVYPNCAILTYQQTSGLFEYAFKLDGFVVKGEGRSIDEALDNVRKAISAITT